MREKRPFISTSWLTWEEKIYFCDYLPLGKAFKNVLCQVWLKLTHFGEEYDKDNSWVFSPILQILPHERKHGPSNSTNIKKLNQKMVCGKLNWNWPSAQPSLTPLSLSLGLSNIECDDEWNMEYFWTWGV